MAVDGEAGGTHAASSTRPPPSEPQAGEAGAGPPALLTEGNAAKLYCLNLIAERAAGRDEPFTILDLGCGSGANFVALLRRHPHVRYVGIEPSRAAYLEARRTLTGLDAELLNRPAYGLRLEPADVVVSFSVLEHVYRRREYLDAVAANLAVAGVALVNYDAGHFVGVGSPAQRRLERAKTLAGKVLARAGDERRYQAFVREDEFRAHAVAAGLRIVEEKVFNTDLKRVYPLVPPERRSAFMARWLELETFVNTLGIEYRDALASIFRTRNFVLARA